MFNLHRIIRITVNFVALLTFLFSIYFYFIGDVFKGNVGIVTVLSLITPRVIYHQTWIKRLLHREILTTAELFLLVALTLNSLGALWLYYEPNWVSYDTSAHFISTFLVTCGVAILYFLHSVFLEKKGNKRKAVIYSFLWSLIIISGWEFFEYFGDRTWGTMMSIQEGQPWDLYYDFGMGLIAIILAEVVIYKYWDYFNKRWLK